MALSRESLLLKALQEQRESAGNWLSATSLFTGADIALMAIILSFFPISALDLTLSLLIFLLAFIVLSCSVQLFISIGETVYTMASELAGLRPDQRTSALHITVYHGHLRIMQARTLANWGILLILIGFTILSYAMSLPIVTIISLIGVLALSILVFLISV